MGRPPGAPASFEVRTIVFRRRGSDPANLAEEASTALHHAHLAHLAELGRQAWSPRTGHFSTRPTRPFGGCRSPPSTRPRRAGWPSRTPPCAPGGSGSAWLAGPSPPAGSPSRRWTVRGANACGSRTSDRSAGRRWRGRRSDGAVPVAFGWPPEWRACSVTGGASRMTRPGAPIPVTMSSTLRPWSCGAPSASLRRRTRSGHGSPSCESRPIPTTGSTTGVAAPPDSCCTCPNPRSARTSPALGDARWVASSRWIPVDSRPAFPRHATPRGVLGSQTAGCARGGTRPGHVSSPPQRARATIASRSASPRSVNA